MTTVRPIRSLLIRCSCHREHIAINARLCVVRKNCSMIFDKIKNLEHYGAVHRHIIDVVRFINEETCSGCEDGTYGINNEGAFVTIETYETKDAAECCIECHDSYIDVQVMIDGVERAGVCHRAACSELDHDPGRDFRKLEGAVDFLTLRAGSFMIFFPDDGHMPKVRLGPSPETVRKAVFKLPVQL